INPRVGKILFFLPIVLLGIWCFNTVKRNNQFIISSPGGLAGEINYYDLGPDKTPNQQSFNHVAQTPYLYFSPEVGDWVWSGRPSITSKDGYILHGTEFWTEEMPFGYLFDDICYDSLVLTYYSCFGDSVSIMTPVLPAGQLNIPVKRLDRLAGYTRKKISKTEGTPEIVISLEMMGCFSFSEQTLKISENNLGILTQYFEFDWEQIFRENISPVSQHLYAKTLAAIHTAQNTKSENESTTFYFAKIKVGNSIIRLNDYEHDLRSIHDLFDLFKQLNPREE
ncbi:MAG: hypothetical protein AAGA31_10190, partial [Bacteroidota bacterium]